ncbi:MAG: hypothetical protein JST53_14135 [Actinobacteria bacterium]|nr:hypothetical protein [Actinomycetota bacterium]
MIAIRRAFCPRRRPAAAFVVLCLVAASAFAAVPSLAAAKPKHQGRTAEARILAPKRDARTTGKTLHVRVRTSAKAPFSVQVDGTDVTNRFHRHGKFLEATLRRGSDYRVGENLLAVTVGKGARALPATTSFVSLKQAKGLLKVTKLAAHGSAPLRFRIRASASLVGLRVTVNGKRYPLGAAEGRRRWTIAIGASDGARYGSNSIVAAAEREGSKRFDRERLRFHVDRGAPLAGAGADQVTRTGKVVILRGGSTVAGTRKGSLLYRWKITAKPHGSHARIADGTSKEARLLPDLPGDYKVRLVAARVSAKVAAEDRESGKAATASATEAATQPTCLEWASTPLVPASSGSASASAVKPGSEGESESASLPFDSLEAPPCVTPVGELTPPPLPLQVQGSLGSDEVEVESRPTESPMGWPIETLAEDGSTRVGPQTFPKQSGWVHMVVLGYKSLTPVSTTTGNQVFQLDEGAALRTAVEHTTDEQLVILTGMGQAQPTPALAPRPVEQEKALGEALRLLGIPSAEDQPLRAAIESGRWSVIGTREQPGRSHTNLHSLGQQPVEGMPGTIPGTLNGWMQGVLSNGAFNFISQEAIPFDTKAEGSSNTVSVFEVGKEKMTSETIVNGSLALHIGVFDLDQPNGLPKAVANYTDVIDNPYVSTNQAGVEAAARQLEQWRDEEPNVLIVMQTFGEEAVGQNTAPWASRYWVNDALIPESKRGLLEWDKQPYLSAKNESELTRKQDERWNPGYPTVAGQVGALTSEVGHDLVAMLGAGNAKKVEVTRLTMVAENHPETTGSSYVDGYAAPSPGRLSGVLVRNARGGLEVESGSGLPPVVGESFRELVFSGPPTPFPYSSGAENEKALEYLAGELWETEHYKSPREAYLKKPSDEWGAEERQLAKVRYEAGKGFELHTFNVVKSQLEREMNDLARIQRAITNWRNLFSEVKSAALVNAESIGAKLVKQVEEDAKKKPTAEAEINPQAVISEALYIVGDLSGFPEDTEALKIPELVGMVASSMGLAEELTPEEPEQAEGTNSDLIRAEGTEIGTALYKRLEAVSRSLVHMEAIFAADWGKMQKAARLAPGVWSYEGTEEDELIQSLATGAKTEIFEALLPMAYTQWVIAPYQTFLMTNGPEPPGNNYVCRHWHETRTADVKPFAGEPEEGLSTAIYRPFDEPGSSAFPAKPFTTPFTIRALKSDADAMEVRKVDEITESEDGIEIHHGGANPPESLMEGLFKAPVGENLPAFPKFLGMNKTAFYAGYGEGPTEWKRVICAQG